MDHAQRAQALFLEGYNCAQATFGAFCDVTGLEFETAIRLASGLGGGMGRMREVCGACTAAFMVMGLLRGYDQADDVQGKARLYEQVQLLVADFRARHGTILCRELLKDADSAPTPSARTAQYYADRPCARYVYSAAQLVDAFLEKTRRDAADAI